MIDPFEMPVPTPPRPRDTIPTARTSHDHLEAEIIKLEQDFAELDRRLQLVQECFDGIRSSALALAAIYRKESP